MQRGSAVSLPGSNIAGNRFEDYQVEFFGIIANSEPYDPDEIDCSIVYEKFDLEHKKSAPKKFAHIWLWRARWGNTKAVYEETWHPKQGWTAAIRDIHFVEERFRERTCKQLLKGRFLIREAIKIMNGGRPENTGMITEENKWEALDHIIEIGIKIYVRENRVYKHDIARESRRYDYGISNERMECNGCAGCKQIDRVIKQCNPTWTWRDDILPRIKVSLT
jgi:hypothetical protein